MIKPSLAQRVSALEEEVARLALVHDHRTPAAPNAWRSTIAMFANDPVMQEIIEEGQKLRQVDREQSQP
ncbi:hypothetical protein ETAA8_52840 [Anatilimnocola aggregata]|uniref:Uncharacterized protein n=1 Tax=Anatilimnocola aggregata TaxID=2528021 RepID=A0A517YIX3_9BACT|nr:hypothetical protein [Anatilimnocola aggregata]QDU30165.1 hypothetical protein ETAA8_52840 [Anatilimnocola aggregata]